MSTGDPLNAEQRLRLAALRLRLAALRSTGVWLVMKPRWNFGMLLPSLGCGRCYRCRRPWWAVRERHTVWHSVHSGQSALCEWCWDRSDSDWCWHAHNWVCSLGGWTTEERDRALSLIDGGEA